MRLHISFVMAALAVALAAPASAQQTLNLTLGHFAVRGEDARVRGDVITENRNLLSFDVAEFSGPTVGLEWLVPLGNFVEAGAGVSFSRRTVPSLYTNFTNRTGAEIEQDLRLRLIPAAFTLRIVPTGQSSAVQPYIGAGLGIVAWRYSESGEFVDQSVRPAVIFRDSFVGSGTTTGAVALGGLRFVGDTLTAGAELRYQKADADLGDRFRHIAPSPRLDLGGWTYQATLGVRFGG